METQSTLQSQFVRLSNTDIQPVLPDRLVKPKLGKLVGIYQKYCKNRPEKHILNKHF